MRGNRLQSARTSAPTLERPTAPAQVKWPQQQQQKRFFPSVAPTPTQTLPQKPQNQPVSTKFLADEEYARAMRVIEARPHNRLIQHLFRNKMTLAVGRDVPSKGYDAIIDLTRQLNQHHPLETQARTVEILKSLFPSWLLLAFKVMFSRPMPEFACKLNAWATALTCEWLMGPCKVNDVEVDGGKLGLSQGVEVQRCRYLEQAGCTSICVNSCKVPTQAFFAQEMGLPLTITPNYEEFSCQFSFGKTPPPQTEDPAFAAPCFSQCPSKCSDKGSALVQMLVVASAGVRFPAALGASTGLSKAGRCHKVEPVDCN